MKFLVLLCAVLHLSLGQITTEDCMMALSNKFDGSLVSGAALRVCSRMDMQCCTQANEDTLGMMLSRALQNNADNFTLGSEVYGLRQNAMTLYNQTSSLRENFITDVVGMLMTNSVDRGLTTSFVRLDGVIENTRDALADALSGNSSVANAVNLTAVIRTFFRDGISRFYFDLTFNDQSPEATACGVNVIFSLLFPRVEQDKMSMLAGNLQRMGDIFQLVRGLVMSAYRVQSAAESFTLSQTCTDIWTNQYACPLCAGNNTPLCLGTCNEVLIGCLSPLNQAIVQLNVFRELVVAGVQSLLTGMPLAGVNLNSFHASYASILGTSNNFNGPLDQPVIDAGCMVRKKRSVNTNIRHKRQMGRADALPDVMIDSNLADRIINTTLPSLVNVSLTSDFAYFCAYLNSNASTCISTFNSLDVAYQGNNPAGMFNTTMLRIQAETQPYVVTDFVNMNDGNKALFMSLLPSRAIPDTSFTIVPSVTPMASPSPTPTPTGDGGGAATVSFSLLTTLVALILTYLL